MDTLKGSIKEPTGEVRSEDDEFELDKKWIKKNKV
jgi:hypothetical protein